MASAFGDQDDSITGINVTPLVDVTLVLLIVFMATAQLIVHRSLSMALPKAAHSDATPSPAVTVRLESDRSLFESDKKVTVQELSQHLEARVRVDPSTKVSLSADSRVSWGDVAAVLDAVRGVGITHISTEVQPKGAGS